MEDQQNNLINRTEVIERAIAIDSLLSLAITNHYFKNIQNDFLLEVMYDEYFSTGLKIRILKKIFSKDIDNKKEAAIRRIFSIRNIYAHLNTRIYNGKNWIVINPMDYDKGFDKQNGFGKGIDFNKLYLEFNDLYKDVSEFLSKLIPQIRK